MGNVDCGAERAMSAGAKGPQECKIADITRRDYLTRVRQVADEIVVLQEALGRLGKFLDVSRLLLIDRL